MKKSFLLLMVVLLTSIATSAQELGLGFQASFPSYGLSLKADLTETHTVQGVFGAFGTVTMISGRYIYNFSETGDSFPITPFVYAQAGQWNYNEDLLGIDESVFGYGIVIFPVLWMLSSWIPFSRLSKHCTQDKNCFGKKTTGST